jgi:DNA-directed RNA polymerase beta' subunit
MTIGSRRHRGARQRSTRSSASAGVSRWLDVEKQFRRGLITEDERYQEVVRIWQEATKQTIGAVRENLNRVRPGGDDVDLRRPR